MIRTLFTLGLLAGLLSSFSLRAEPTNAPTGPNHRQSPGSQPSIAGYAVGGPIGVLTDQQRASYENALRAERGQMMELDARLRAAREDLLNTSVDSKFDEAVIQRKAMAAARIEAEMTVLRIKAFSQVQPPLTSDEIAKIKAGRPGPIHRFEHPEAERQLRREVSPAETNRDINGLPPKQ